MMDDLISREDALKVCEKYNGQGYVWSCIRGDIEKLPSAQPTQSNAPNTLDAISREEAIDALTDYWHGIENRHKTLDGEMAVYCDCKNIIKNLPSAQLTQNNRVNSNNAFDTISRQAAIDDIKAMYEWHDVVTEDRLIEHMKRLPSAQPDLEDIKNQALNCSAELLKLVALIGRYAREDEP